VRGFRQLELRRSQPVDTGADPLSIAALADETAAALVRRPLPDAAIFDALYTRFRMLTDATEAVRRRDRQANLRLKADNVELAAISEKRRHEQQEITRIADERLNQVRALGIGIEEREQRIGELGRTIRYLETLVGS
jgi:septal ring factor EnvC (AmiA/AmiB activator)